MTERSDSFDYDESEIINRYLEMVKKKNRLYFDVFEFENIIDYFIEKNEIKLASEAISYALSIHPNAMSIMEKKAHVLINDGLHYQAMKILKEILKIEQYNSSATFLLGVVYCSVGEVSKALQLFDKAISLDSEDSEDFMLNAGTTLEQIGQYEFAIKYFKQALALDLENSTALFELGFCCEKINRDEESIKYYKQYLSLDPYSRLAWTNLSGVYCKLEKYEDSIDAIEFAIAIDSKYTFSYFQKGICEIFNQQYEDGIQSLKYFLEKEPSDADAHYYMGEAYAKLGNSKTALNFLEQAIALDNNHSDAYYSTASILYNEKKYADSYYSIKKALKIEPDFSEYWHLSALINFKLGFINDSEEAFKNALDMEHSDPQIWIDYLDLIYVKKNPVKTINVLVQAYEHFSTNAEINYRLAANLALIQNLDTAVFHLNEALKIEPSKIDIFRSIYTDKNNILDNLIDKYLCNSYNANSSK
jgi:tetratricopeptide (TPR) repeat protein